MVLIQAPYIHVWNFRRIKMNRKLYINPAFLVISLKLNPLAWSLPVQGTGLLWLGLFLELPSYFRSKPYQFFLVNIKS